MAPTMTTRNAGRRTAATRDRRTGGQTGRGGGRTKEQTGRFGRRTGDQGSRRGDRAYTDRFHELARLVPHLVTPKTKRIKRYIYGLALQIHEMVAATEPSIIQSVILKVGVLIDEAIRNGSLKKSGEKRGDGEDSSKEGNVKGDNKRART
ncbi:hypothetical protein Tco_0900201 [Tanacetum coccineum]